MYSWRLLRLHPALLLDSFPLISLRSIASWCCRRISWLPRLRDDCCTRTRFLETFGYDPVALFQPFDYHNAIFDITSQFYVALFDFIIVINNEKASGTANISLHCLLWNS